MNVMHYGIPCLLQRLTKEITECTMIGIDKAPTSTPSHKEDSDIQNIAAYIFRASRPAIVKLSDHGGSIIRSNEDHPPLDRLGRVLKDKISGPLSNHMGLVDDGNMPGKRTWTRIY